MATLEEFIAEATTEIENNKPMYVGTSSGLIEYTEEEYQQAITDLANSRYDIQQNGYKQARQENYGNLEDQLDMMYWDAVNGTTTWQDHITEVKTNNPKPT